MSTHDPAITPAMAPASSSASAAAVGCGQEQNLEEHPRDARSAPHRGRDRADPRVGGCDRRACLVAAPAGVAGGKARPTEPADIGLQSLDPVGQVANDRHELWFGLRLGLRLRIASVGGALRRAHAAGPSSCIESIASRAFACTRARRSLERLVHGSRLVLGLRVALRRELLAQLVGRIAVHLGRRLCHAPVGMVAPLREQAAESRDAGEAGEPCERALHEAMVSRPAEWVGGVGVEALQGVTCDCSLGARLPWSALPALSTPGPFPARARRRRPA